MPATFHWNMEVLQGKPYGERAKECRRVARVCPEYLKESYLEMAVEYEQLAKKADELLRRAPSIQPMKDNLRRRALDRDGRARPDITATLSKKLRGICAG